MAFQAIIETATGDLLRFIYAAVAPPFDPATESVVTTEGVGLRSKSTPGRAFNRWNGSSWVQVAGDPVAALSTALSQIADPKPGLSSRDFSIATTGLVIDTDVSGLSLTDQTTVVADPTDTKFVVISLRTEEATMTITILAREKTTGEYALAAAGFRIVQDLAEYSLVAAGSTLVEV